MTTATKTPEKKLAGIADEKVLVLDFGSQYVQLIARRVREQNVYCEIVRHDITPERVREIAPKGLILSGGPASVYENGAPHCDPKLFDLGIPVLGICYGMQLVCEALGGKCESAPAREFGRAHCTVLEADGVFAGVPQETEVWMSHGDQVTQCLRRFRAAGPHRYLPDHRREAQAAADLRRAISSGSHAHAAGQNDSGEFFDQSLRLPRHLETGRFRRTERFADLRKRDRRSPRDLRTFRRS